MKPVYLLKDQIVENNSSKTISEKVICNVTATQSYEIRHSESTSKIWKAFSSVTIRVSVPANLFEPGNLDEAFEESDKTIDQSVLDTTKTTHSQSKTHQIKKTLSVPPHTSIKHTMYINKVEKIPLAYKSTLTVHGNGPENINRGQLDSGSIRSWIKAKNPNFNLKELHHDQYSISFQEEGIMTVSMGLSSHSENIPMD